MTKDNTWPLHLRRTPAKLHKALDDAKYELAAKYKRTVSKEEVALQILKDRLLPKE